MSMKSRNLEAVGELRVLEEFGGCCARFLRDHRRFGSEALVEF